MANNVFMKWLRLSAFTGVLLAQVPWAHARPVVEDHGSYIVENSHVHTYQSSIVDQEYKLIVSVPEGYDPNAEKDYPVVYVLDGQWNATMVKDILSKSEFDGMVPQAIVVAITWSGEVPDYRFLRFRDLAPLPLAPVPNSGQAELFLEAIEEEMIPFVMEHYKTNNKRVLLGSSLGGIFATYALLQKPQLFDGIVATAAPYSGLGEGYFEGLIADLSNSKALSGKRMYLAVGSLGPNLSQVTDLGKVLANSHLKGVRIKTVVIPGVGHAGIEPIAFTKGLQFAFRRPRVKLSRRFLRRYEGEYMAVDSPDDPLLRIELQGKRLAIPQVISDRKLYASSETTFYMEGISYDLSFREDEGLTHMTVNFGGNQIEFVKAD